MTFCSYSNAMLSMFCSDEASFQKGTTWLRWVVGGLTDLSSCAVLVTRALFTCMGAEAEVRGFTCHHSPGAVIGT